MARWHSTEFDFLPAQAFCPRPGGGMTLEGGGSSTPAPDPRLVEAQVKNLGIQDDMIAQIIGNANEMAPLQKEQTQFALDTSRSAWAQSQADREYAVGQRDKLTGLQGRIVDEASNFNSEGRQNELAGQAGADVAQAYASARDQQQRDMTRMGVNPSDGKFAAMKNQMSISQALGTAQAMTGARTQARTEGRALTDRAANVLSGYPAMGMQTTAATAGYGEAGQRVASNGLAGLNSGLSQAGGMAGGAGNSASNMWGKQADAQATSQAGQGAMTGSVIGAGAGIAIAMI